MTRVPAIAMNRQGEETDIPALIALDCLAQTDERRRRFIRKSVVSGKCMVATAEDEVIAYTVLEYTFYDNGFLSMLYVHPNHRRKGVASSLLKYAESACETNKIFASTNRSNQAMQSLLDKAGYERSGVIENLDEGDPELVYFKRLKKDT